MCGRSEAGALAFGLNLNLFGLFMEKEPHIYMGGEKVVFWGPMSWTVIYGLIFATFLTLVVVPTMYLLLLWLEAVSK